MLDPADDLVTEDQRFPQGERTHRAVPVVVQVRPADTAVGVADQHLTRFGGRFGQVVEPQITCPVDHESLHSASLSRKVVNEAGRGCR